MVRLLTSGAELNDAVDGAAPGMDGGFSALTAVSVSTAIVRSGANSWKHDSGAGNTSAIVTTPLTTLTSGTSYFFRMYMYFVQLPTSTVSIVQFTASGIEGVSAKLTSEGKLQLFNITSGLQLGSDSVATLTTGAWYRIELLFTPRSAADDGCGLRLGGVNVAIDSAEAITSTMTGWTIEIGWLQAPGANCVCYSDDYALNDNSGATTQESYPAEGKVVLLVPASDSVRDALWTGGSGGTSNLFEAVNNRPPVGTATESDTTQIEHAGGAAGTTDDYEANMTTYTAAGVPSGSSVSVVDCFMIDGEDVSTGAKLLAIEVLSNPAIAISANFTVGDVSPVLLGTYPSEWGRHRNANVSYAPSVALAVAPVMRVRRPETASRVASVCFMGMYVDYIPGKAPPIFQRAWRRWAARSMR